MCQILNSVFTSMTDAVKYNEAAPVQILQINYAAYWVAINHPDTSLINWQVVNTGMWATKYCGDLVHIWIYTFIQSLTDSGDLCWVPTIISCIQIFYLIKI